MITFSIVPHQLVSRDPDVHSRVELFVTVLEPRVYFLSTFGHTVMSHLRMLGSYDYPT